MLRFLLFLCLVPLLANSNTITISAKYREAANTFGIMDCVSGWWDNTFCQDGGGGAQKYWAERFGLSEEDKELFKKYDKIRRQYFKGLGLPQEKPIPGDGLFAMKSGIDEDLIAPAFYSSETLEQAFVKLKAIVNEKDLEFLKGFYDHFKSKYQLLLAESEPLKKKAKEVNKNLQNKKYSVFFTKVSKYYSVTENMNYEVLFNWFPPLKHNSASPSNQFLIFQENPEKHIHYKDEDIVFHEIIHTLSARQPQKQKAEISKAFLEACPKMSDKFIGIYRGSVLEEPMAVTIGQIQFLKEFAPDRLSWEYELYNNPWISFFAKAINPVIERDWKDKKSFSAETGKKLGLICHELFKASAFVETKE